MKTFGTPCNVPLARTVMPSFSIHKMPDKEADLNGNKNSRPERQVSKPNWVYIMHVF